MRRSKPLWGAICATLILLASAETSLAGQVAQGPTPSRPQSLRPPVHATPPLPAALPPATGPSDLDLAFYHAPIHYQDTDSTNYRADYITRVDYDNNWKADDNWDNLNRFQLRAHAYFSVVETCTHWFIVYGFFHPRDWTDSAADQEHENDLEGLLAIVRKDGSRFGRLEGIVTVFHNDFYSYTPAGSSLTKGRETIDGTLTMRSYEGSWRPLTAQQAKGHGLKAWPFAGDFQGKPNQDGIIYFPSKTTAEVPSSGNDRDVKYQLLDIFAPGGLWERQLAEAGLPRASAQTFAQWGKFKGNESGGCGRGLTVTCVGDSANLSWKWDDGDDARIRVGTASSGAPIYASEVQPGEMALDPAHLVDLYFDGLGNFSHKYLRNRYIADLRSRGYGPGRLPRGWPAQLDLGSLFLKLTTQCP